MSAARLLLVDDAPEIALIVQRFARRANHAIVSFADAESAWQHLQNETAPDLAILDLNLPGASGADLCRQMRRAPRLAKARIALFSHWDRAQDIAAGLDAGVDFVLSKDLLVQPEAWLARLAEILPPAPGRAPPLSLPWWDTHASLLPIVVPRVNQALALLAREPLGTEVVHDLVRRSAERAGLVNGCLSADGLGLHPKRAAATAVRDFLHACAEQTWRLLGTAGSDGFRNLLDKPPSPTAENSTNDES
jgi:DNA-binding response OmpR family regulator